MERPSVAAYHPPELATVNPSVASATEGAAPNSPAKLFGSNRSPRIAKDETTPPPITKRRSISFMVPGALAHPPRLGASSHARLNQLLDLPRPLHSEHAIFLS